MKTSHATKLFRFFARDQKKSSNYHNSHVVEQHTRVPSLKSIQPRKATVAWKQDFAKTCCISENHRCPINGFQPDKFYLIPRLLWVRFRIELESRLWTWACAKLSLKPSGCCLDVSFVNMDLCRIPEVSFANIELCQNFVEAFHSMHVPATTDNWTIRDFLSLLSWDSGKLQFYLKMKKAWIGESGGAYYDISYSFATSAKFSFVRNIRIVVRKREHILHCCSLSSSVVVVPCWVLGWSRSNHSSTSTSCGQPYPCS